MAAVAAMRTTLTRLGFTQDVAATITNVQGVDSIDELKFLNDKEVEGLCNNIRKPGGMMPNPDAGAQGEPAMIRNPEQGVSARAENNLKLCCYFIRHCERISRSVTVDQITLANIRALHDLRDAEINHIDPEPMPKLMDSKNWPKTMEGIVEYLRGCLGVTKIPLSYVVRDHIEATPEANDPETNYDTPQDEMIAHAPMMIANGDEHPTFLTDRQTIWDKISDLTREHECWTYVKPAQRARNGRQGYTLLFDHYLGQNSMANQASLAEAKLKNSSYQGERCHWNFKRFVCMQVEQHEILNGLTKYGYSMIDNGSKVRYLLGGIKTKDLDPVKVQIMASPGLREDYEGCGNLYQDYIAQHAPTQRDYNVSQVGSSKKDGGGKCRGGGGVSFSDESLAGIKVDNRYYIPQEYASLDPKQKAKLKTVCHKCGHKPSKKKKRGGGPNDDKLDKLGRQVSQLVTALTGKKGEDSESDSDDSDDKSSSKSNRSHVAITHQRSKK